MSSDRSTDVIYKCMTKATTAEGDGVRRSLNWAFARRGTLYVMQDALVCGDWRIPFHEIGDAVLFSVRQTFIPGYVLRIVAKDKVYQFGLNPNLFWKGELPFSVRREKARLGYSWISILARVIVVAWIISVVWRLLR